MRLKKTVAATVMILAMLFTAKAQNYEILETKVLCKQKDRYIGWPTIAKTQSGELLVVFSGDRDAHVCPFGVVQMVRSRDNGRTWSEPTTINNTPLDDRDAGIIQTSKGTLLVNWFTSLAFDREKYYQKNPSWRRHADKLGPETRKYWLGNWMRRSVDNGQTWEKPVKHRVSAPHGPIELTDGRLLIVGSADHDGDKFIGVEESDDDGRSWRLIAKIPFAPGDSPRWQWEPHVVQTTGDTLIAMIRSQPRDDRSQYYMLQTESFDGGRTWTTAHKTPIWGYPPHLIKLNDGRLLVTYGVRRPPFSERACLSHYGGKTWDIENEITIQGAINGDLGYPASVQLDDGSIYTVYYQIDKPGEKTSLMGTHWQLK